jgi:hypothetical protein
MMVRHAFASFFARLLRGYQECLVVRSDRASCMGAASSMGL